MNRTPEVKTGFWAYHQPVGPLPDDGPLIESYPPELQLESRLFLWPKRFLNHTLVFISKICHFPCPGCDIALSARQELLRFLQFLLSTAETLPSSSVRTEIHELHRPLQMSSISL